MTSEEDVRDLSHPDAADLSPGDIPAAVHRRAFMMRSAVIGATAVIAGCSRSDLQSSAGSAVPAHAAPAPQARPLSPELEVVKKAKGPVMTTLDEFYNVRPGETTLAAMALTAREMNAEYKETPEGGPAVSVTLC